MALPNSDIYNLLEEKVKQYNRTSFLTDDPIQIPHRFTKKQDIEIMGFLAATLAWGQRKTIINNCQKLISLFDEAPHDFIVHHQEKDLERFVGFKHRTFNDIDMLYFIAFLKAHYLKNNSLEVAFTKGFDSNEPHVGLALSNFHQYFCSLPYFPPRTQKHVATPERNSACKRLNMFLRWMVRNDKQGVDFGIWNTIQPNQLLIPLDVHVERVARNLGLLRRKQRDFKAVVELTENLKTFDAQDPAKYDFALFALGVYEQF